MNCKNCNAVMRVDEERKLYVCPYCESVEPFEGVSKEELQGMLHAAMSDVRKETMKEARAVQAGHAYGDIRSAAQKTKDGVILALQIIYCVILGFFSIGIFTEYVWVGVVSLLQLILMIVSMTMKKKWNQTGEAKYWKIKKGCQIAVILLIIAWFIALTSAQVDRYLNLDSAWPTAGLGSDLPEPEGKIRHAYATASDFYASVTDTSKENYDAYVAACKEIGYTIDAEETDTRYVAYHEKTDNKLTVSYYKEMSEFNVQEDKAIVMNDSWPTGEMAKLIPQPKTEKCSIYQLSQDNLQIYVGDLTHDEFIEYVTECMEAGYDGSFTKRDDDFDGWTDDNVYLRIEFQRGRIMFINVHILSY